jgi:hypothetical protein
MPTMTVGYVNWMLCQICVMSTGRYVKHDLCQMGRYANFCYANYAN